MNELCQLLLHKTNDEEDNALRVWINEKFFGHERRNFNMTEMKSVVEYLDVTEFSIPFTIKGCTFKQGDIYEFDNSADL